MHHVLDYYQHVTLGNYWDLWFYDEHGNEVAVTSFHTKPTARQIRKAKKAIKGTRYLVH